MTQLSEAVAGAEEVVETAPEQAAEQTTTTEDTLYGDDQQEVADQETDEEDDIEEEQEAVAAPASLNAEEKATFAQLPAEAQRAMSDILSRRDRDIQQGLEQARSAQRDAQRTAADQVAQIQAQSAQQFTALVQAFAPQPPSPALAQENPGLYIAHKAQYDADMEAYNGLVGQISSLKAQSDAHGQTRSREWVTDQVNQLKSIPEYANPETQQQFLSDVKAVGLEIGYSEDLINQADAQDIMALNKARVWKAKADKWDQHQKKRNERPRQAQGRFAAAPAGNGAAPANQPNDALKALYPND